MEGGGLDRDAGRREHRFSGFSVSVCNSGVFGCGMYLVPEARMDDGLLDVVFNGDVSRASCAAAQGLQRQARRRREPVSFRAREVTFSADRPFTAYADGDPIADLPATFRVVPAALRVLAP